MTIFNSVVFGVTALLISLNLVLLAATVVWAARGLSGNSRTRSPVPLRIPVRQRRRPRNTESRLS
jgi:hypothetical protein